MISEKVLYSVMTTPNVNTNQNISLCRNVLFVIVTNTTRRGTRPSCYENVIHLVLKGKVKCTLVQALRLCTGRTAHMGSRGIALFFLDHGTRRGEGSASRPYRSLCPGKTRYPLYRRLGGPKGRCGQEAGWAPGPVWTGAENHTPTGIRSPDLPARSQSLYRLRYPAMPSTKLVCTDPSVVLGVRARVTDVST